MSLRAEQRSTLAGAPIPVDVTDRWARELGQVDLARVLGAALAAANPVIVGVYDAGGNRMPSMDVAARPGYVDMINRAARELGIVYGDVGQLAQRATRDLYIQLRNAGVEIDPRAIYGSQAQQLQQKAATFELLMGISDGAQQVTITDGINPDAAKNAADVNIVQAKTLKMASINCAALGDNTIIAAVANKKIKVYAIALVVTAAVNVYWKSGANQLTGDMNFAGKGEGYSMTVNPPAWLLVNTAVNEAIILNLSAAIAVDGWVCYWDDDAS